MALVFEVAFAGKDHGNTQFIGLSNYLIILFGTAGLHNTSYTRLGGIFYSRRRSQVAISPVTGRNVAFRMGALALAGTGRLCGCGLRRR